MKDGELVELFKNYALEVVNAAVPQLRQNGDIMEWGSECLPIFAEKGRTTHMDILVSTVSLAKYHHDELVAMSKIANPSESVNPSTSSDSSTSVAKNGMIDNIRKILFVLENWTVRLHTNSSLDVFKVYLAKHQEGSEFGGREKRWETVANCFRFIVCMRFSDTKTFFDKLTEGFGIVAEIMSEMRNDDKGNVDSSKRTDLSKVVEEISQCELSTRKLKSLEASIVSYLMQELGQ